MLFFLVSILFVIICPSTVANVLIYFSQVLMLPSYRTILVYSECRSVMRSELQNVFQVFGLNFGALSIPEILHFLWN